MCYTFSYRLADPTKEVSEMLVMIFNQSVCLLQAILKSIETGFSLIKTNIEIIYGVNQVYICYRNMSYRHAVLLTFSHVSCLISKSSGSI